MSNYKDTRTFISHVLLKCSSYFVFVILSLDKLWFISLYPLVLGNTDKLWRNFSTSKVTKIFVLFSQIISVYNLTLRHGKFSKFQTYFSIAQKFILITIYTHCKTVSDFNIIFHVQCTNIVFVDIPTRINTSILSQIFELNIFSKRK